MYWAAACLILSLPALCVRSCRDSLIAVRLMMSRLALAATAQNTAGSGARITDRERLMTQDNMTGFI